MWDTLFFRRFASHLCCSFALSITMLLAAPAAAQDARTRQYLKAALIRPLRTLFNRNATVQKTALLTLTLGAILFLAHPAHAQFIGDRMRITTQHGTEITGQIKSLDNTSLTILMDYSRELSIAYADMARLQRSLGVRSYYRDGAKAGLVVGVGGSIIAAAVAPEGGVAALLGIGVFTPILTLGGMISGAAIRGERWKRLDIPDQNAASVMPVIGVHPGGSLALENRMRITTQGGEELIGRMKSFDNSFLTILTDSTELSIAYADMARLQRSLGVRSRFIKGTFIGLGGGMVVGALAASDIQRYAVSTAGGLAAIGAFLLGSGGGALLGAIIGASIKREKWERLDIPDQSAASVMPVIGVHPGGSLALGARISF